MVQEGVETYGGVDVAVNNAGIEGETEPLADLSEDAWDRVLDVNLKALWPCMKHDNAIVWLCSDEASFVTGNAYPVDGGYLAQ